ncbi:MAG: SPASM domain-containing protein, partial [Candidatus Hydrogenedentes bacterium]|nr:SPASM domain-containing protein [Candidatus Hydrogenedentota bacterium]
MARSTFHRFELNGQRFAIDPETCFCFECDEISWDVLPFYPDSTVNRIFHELEGKYERKELNEVIGEFEWLRATKSIIAHKKQEDFFKDFEQEQGLRRLVIRLPRQTTEEQKKRGWFRGAEDAVIPGTALETGHDAINLLLNRAGDQPVLHLEFLEEGTVHNPELLARLCAHALKQARLAGKGLSAAVHVTGVDIKNAPDSLGDHAVAVKLEFQNPEDLAEHMKALSAPGPHTLARWVKVLQSDSEGVAGRIVVTPRHAGYGKVVETLHQAGFRTIELDLDGAYLANPGLSPRDMLQGLSESAVYYARCLAKQQYFRLDPIAPLFYRIYNGTPLRRADPAGMNELAVDEDGAVYPSWRALGRDEFKLGSLTAGSLDEGALGVYEGLGSQLISTCRRCWARNLCGGGTAAVHHALTGSVRTPQEAWCDAQRDWLAAAVSAFSHLSAHG